MQLDLVDPELSAHLHIQTEVPKPSEGLEYTYARKPSNYDHERKDLAHIWEVGGSQEFAEEIAQGDQLFLTAKQVRGSVLYGGDRPGGPALPHS